MGDKIEAQTATPDIFGICANLLETDRLFKDGAKAWIVGGTGGEGWYKFEWMAAARNDHQLKKWAPTMRFHNFRAKWVPEHRRHEIAYLVFERRADAEVAAIKLEALAMAERIAHPNRRPRRQTTGAEADRAPA